MQEVWSWSLFNMWKENTMETTANGKTEADVAKKEHNRKKESKFVKFLYSGGILVFIVLAFVLSIVIMVLFK